GVLYYFSPSSSTDIPVGGALGGFTFQSATNPITLGIPIGMTVAAPRRIDYGVVLSISGIQVVPVPEPSSLGMGVTAAMLCLGYAWGRKALASASQPHPDCLAALSAS